MNPVLKELPFLVDLHISATPELLAALSVLIWPIYISFQQLRTRSKVSIKIIVEPLDRPKPPDIGRSRNRE